ncbi:helix-turn-helix domain-containing protein [Photorhabdus australis]|nr:helix-turn-helix domain-containing protein [Photorhabdus australis]
MPGGGIEPPTRGFSIIANALGQKPDEIWPSRYQKRRKGY